MARNNELKCKQTATDPYFYSGGIYSCRKEIAAWAEAYRNAENANEPQCRDEDPNFKSSQETFTSCPQGNN